MNRARRNKRRKMRLKLRVQKYKRRCLTELLLLGQEFDFYGKGALATWKTTDIVLATYETPHEFPTYARELAELRKRGST